MWVEGVRRGGDRESGGYNTGIEDESGKGSAWQKMKKGHLYTSEGNL